MLLRPTPECFRGPPLNASAAHPWARVFVCVCATLLNVKVLHDYAMFSVIRHLTGHKAAVRSTVFHPYGEFIASGSDDHKIRMWDFRRKACIFTYKVTGCQRWLKSANVKRFCYSFGWSVAGSWRQRSICGVHPWRKMDRISFAR